MKKAMSLFLAVLMAATLLTGCGPSGSTPSSQTPDTQAPSASQSAQTDELEGEITFWHSFTQGPRLETIQAAADQFMTDHPKVKINIETFSWADFYTKWTTGLASGNVPDMSTAQAGQVVEMINADAIIPLDDLIDDIGRDRFYESPLQEMTYSDGNCYAVPIYSHAFVMWYRKDLLEKYNLEVPTTWDEMWELGDKAAAEGTYLFTYPTTGYFDAFFYALMYAAGGPEFFNKATHYEEGIWDTPEAKTCFDIVNKLASYTNPITPAQANDQDFTQNQQLVLDNKALFMPNGTWIVGEMAEAPRADGFEWGMTALPAVKAGGDQYSYTWFEQAWIPAGAEHLDAAKQFVAYLYSDEACKLFAESGAIQPVLGIADDLEGDNKMFYSIYDNGAKAAMGNFAAFSAIPGVEVRTVFFDPVNSLVSGSMTEQQWIDGIKSASDQMRANIVE